MKLPSFRFFAFALSVAAGLLSTQAAHAQSGTPRDPYVITTAPYTVTKPGYYILGNNLNYAGTGGTIITIGVSNVTLDFNGFYIAGSANNPNQGAIGIDANEKSNLTIKNGTIAYCSYGIYLTGNGQSNTNAVGELIDNMRMTYCFNAGIFLSICPASRIQNCQISQTGYSGGSSAFAIYCPFGGATIQNNVISTVTGSSGYGVNSNNCLVRQNTVSNATYGIYGGKYQDNLTINCMVPVSEGTDAGGNN